MTETPLPENIQVLLAPIENGVGSDLDRFDPRYQELEFGIDDKANAEVYSGKAESLLKEHGKHFQIISWLALCWLRMKGLRGFRDALVLLQSTMEAFPGQVYPDNEGEEQRARKAIEFLKYPAFKGIINKVEPTFEYVAILHECKQLLATISNTFEAQYKAAGPDFSTLLEVINKKAPSQIDSEEATVPPINEGENSSPTKESAETEAENPSDNEIDHLTNKTADNSGVENVNGEGELAKTHEYNASEQEAGNEKLEDEEIQEEEFSQEVLDLLEDIDADYPIGINIENSPDQEDQVLYYQVESELEKRSGIDYELCNALCTQILIERGKHLRVATWMAVIWYRQRGLKGLYAGLQLISGLLNKYGLKTHPGEPEQLVKIIQSLNNDPRLRLLTRTGLGNEKAEYEITDEALKNLKKDLREDRNDDRKEDELKKEEEISTDELYRKIHPLKGQKFSGKLDFREALNKAFKGVKKALNNDEEIKERLLVGLMAIFESEKAGNEVIRFGFVENTIRELKNVGIPEEALVKLGKIESDLKENGETMEFKGWGRCYDWLSLEIGDETASLYSPVLEACFNTNLAYVLALEKQVKQFRKQCEQLVKGQQNKKQEALSAPNLNTLEEMIRGLAGQARELIQKADEELKEKFSEKESKEVVVSRGSKTSKKEDKGVTTKTKRETAVASTEGSGVSVTKLEINYASEAEIAFKKAIRFFFEAPRKEGEVKESTLEDDNALLQPRIYGLSRVFNWSKVISAPADKMLEAPNEVRRNYLKKLYNNLDFKTLIREIEVDFMNNVAFLFWFDGQKLVVDALEQIGGMGIEAAAEVKIHLARLLSRLPELSEFTFSDEKTPFASSETREWIEEEVLTTLGGGKEKIMPPLLGEEYDEINEVYVKACESLPDGFEENAQEMQLSIQGETRARGRFLIQLNLANFYSLSGKHKIARAKFNQLISELDNLKITDWDQALCVSLWQSAYLNNQKLLRDELNTAESNEIETQQRELFEYVGRYDGVLAINLSNFDNQ